MADEPGKPLRISREEVDEARVPPSPAVRSPPSPIGPARPPAAKLALASLVLAIIGIPLVGFLLGPIAIVCGAVALSGAGHEERRGARIAAAGIVLGILDFAGWTIGLYVVLSRPAAPVVLEPQVPFFAARPALDVAAAPPHIERALRANVRVLCSNGAVMGTGSGVVVARSADDAFLLTNRHVALCGGAGSGGVLRVVASDGQQSEAEIRWLAPDGIDVALLRSGWLSGLATVDLGRRAAKVGDSIFVVGNPLGLASTYTTGTVSAIRATAASPRSIQVLQIQAAVNQGHSGGGLYTSNGQLLGLVTWTTDKRLAEGVGFAISVRDVVDLLEGAGDAWKELLSARAGAPQ